MTALLILFGFLLLIAAFVILPMQFGIHYEKTAVYEKFYVCFSVFGILVKIPVKTNGEKAKKKKISKGKKNKLSVDTFRQSIDTLGEIAEVSKNEIANMLSYLRNHTTCKTFDFKIVFGTGDAAKTGIATGVVWGSGTMLLKIIDSFIGIKKIKMNVFPDFTQKKFEIYLKTILIMKPIHFIIVIKRIKNTVEFIKSKYKNM